MDCGLSEQMFSDQVLDARNYSKHTDHKVIFSQQNSNDVIFLTHFTNEETKTQKKFTDLFKVSRLVRGSLDPLAEPWAQCVWHTMGKKM